MESRKSSAIIIYSTIEAYIVWNLTLGLQQLSLRYSLKLIV